MSRKTKKFIANTNSSRVRDVFLELLKNLGDKYSSHFLYDKAERIVKLHSANYIFNDGYGNSNTHSRNYYTRDVLCIVENDPWLPVYNESLEDVDCSYNHNQFLKELGVR